MTRAREVSNEGWKPTVNVATYNGLTGAPTASNVATDFVQLNGTASASTGAGSYLSGVTADAEL